MMDKILPQSAEAERSTLGAMLLDPDAVAKVAEILRPEDFYLEAHRLIYEQMRELFGRAEPVDLVTLTEALRAAGNLDQVGGVAFLAELAQFVPTAANVEHYARVVEEKALLRSLIRASGKLVERGYAAQEEVSRLLEEAAATIEELSQRRTQRSFASLKEVLLEFLDRLDTLSLRQGITGLASGFRDLDLLTSGFQHQDLVVVAARPSMGKTTLCLNIAAQAALQGTAVAVFSLEMSREQVVQRILAGEAGVDAQRLRTGTLDEEDWRRITAASGRLGEMPLFIDDTPALSPLELRARARRIQAEGNLGLVVVDYLQLMHVGGRQENRQQEISYISRSLKALAREMGVPLLALSQLSRAVESRQDRRPLLSDLRESGSIEQDADVVIFIYRDDYYNPDSERKNVAELIVAKQRNGPTGSVELVFKGEWAKFLNLERAAGGVPPEAEWA
ncbi:MAG: replicative DNA helicase [Thermaerobacter sp.]|jgi:replicative DNA helicase|nr:replicative DNA helicase [Thermaerobacter sp.]MDA8144639.1 replicative DNA helicase [Thermaerobacter sp.]